MKINLLLPNGVQIWKDIKDLSIGFSFEIVDELPSENIKTNVIYLVSKEDPSTSDTYVEWIYTTDGKWESIGTTEVNLDSKENVFIYAEPPARDYSSSGGDYYPEGTNFIWNNRLYKLINYSSGIAQYFKVGINVISESSPPESVMNSRYVSPIEIGDICINSAGNLYICKSLQTTYDVNTDYTYSYTWEQLTGRTSLSAYGITDAYTKDEINQILGNIEQELSEI